MDMRNVVTRIEEKLKGKIEEIEVLEKKIDRLEKDNKMMARTLRMNEENNEYLTLFRLGGGLISPPFRKIPP